MQRDERYLRLVIWFVERFAGRRVIVDVWDSQTALSDKFSMANGKLDS